MPESGKIELLETGSGQKFIWNSKNENKVATSLQ